MHISAPEDSKPLSRTEFEMETPGRAIGAPRDLGPRHFHRPSAEVVQQSIHRVHATKRLRFRRTRATLIHNLKVAYEKHHRKAN
jgi:hypothetical protein